MGLDPNRTRITVTPDGGSALTFCELNVQPPGYAGSGKVDNTSSCSTAETSGKIIKEYLPGSYIEITDGAANVHYDPSQITAILAAIEVDGTVLFTYGDGSTESIPGYINEFTPTGQDTVDNEQVWTADMVLVFTGGSTGKPTYTPAP